jgi:hypothetical protein
MDNQDNRQDRYATGVASIIAGVAVAMGALSACLPRSSATFDGYGGTGYGGTGYGGTGYGGTGYGGTGYGGTGYGVATYGGAPYEGFTYGASGGDPYGQITSDFPPPSDGPETITAPTLDQPALLNQRVVSVAVVDVLVGPRQGGTAWDGTKQINEAVLRDLQALLSKAKAPGVVTAAALEAGKLLNGLSDKPDVAGSLEYQTPSGSGTIALPKNQDTWTPGWPTLRIQHVLLASQTRLVLTLYDVDVVNHDRIGTAVIDASALAAAADAGVVLQIPVEDQTLGQVLFVGLLVLPE